MNKKIYLLCSFLDPISNIEITKKIVPLKIINVEYDMIEKNILPLNSLFEAIKENIITVKKCWEQEDLLSQKRYWSSGEKFFQNF